MFYSKSDLQGQSRSFVLVPFNNHIRFCISLRLQYMSLSCTVYLLGVDYYYPSPLGVIYDAPTSIFLRINQWVGHFYQF